MIWGENCDRSEKPDRDHCIECGAEIEDEYYMIGGECYCPDCAEAHRLYVFDFEEET